MSRFRFVLACLTLAFLCRIASAQSTTLSMKIVTPSPPITDTEPIQIDAVSPQFVFPDTGHGVFSTFTRNGFGIDWEIYSYDDRSGVQAPILLPLGAALNLGSLLPGTYSVQANWQNYAVFILPGAPTSGTGSINFTVVPARGDFNCDGRVDAKDIQAALQALTDPSGYSAQYGQPASNFQYIGDFNNDGYFTNADLQGFLNYLKSGPVSTVPEPSTLALFTLGAVGLLAVRRR